MESQFSVRSVVFSCSIGVQIQSQKPENGYVFFNNILEIFYNVCKCDWSEWRRRSFYHILNVDECWQEVYSVGRGHIL